LFTGFRQVGNKSPNASTSHHHLQPISVPGDVGSIYAPVRAFVEPGLWSFLSSNFLNAGGLFSNSGDEKLLRLADVDNSIATTIVATYRINKKTQNHYVILLTSGARKFRLVSLRSIFVNLLQNTILLKKGQRNAGLLQIICDRLRNGEQMTDDLAKLTWLRRKFPDAIPDFGIHYDNESCNKHNLWQLWNDCRNLTQANLT
jgi:hypothetical protein